MSGIYRIVHIATGREYIGQATDIGKRWAAHTYRLNGGKHHSPHLQNAWQKYGAGAFLFEVIQLCGVADLNAAEQAHLDARRPAFNTAKVAGTRRGVPHDAAARARISASNRGKKRSPQACANIAAGLTGLRHSDAAKAKMRAAKMGREHTDESKANMGAAQRARPRPPSEYDSRRGVKRDPEASERSAAARRGAKRTDEQRARMRAAALAMPADVRQKIADSRRAAHARRLSAKGEI